jgi:hypothetical protein
MLNKWVNFIFSIMKTLWEVAQENLVYIQGRYGFGSIFMDVSHTPIYRVSHSKEGKVILLWWGYRFWFSLIFWVLRVHEIDPFMPNSSVFIFLCCAPSIGWYVKVQKKIWKKEFECTKCKATFKFLFQHFWLFYAFLVRMTACTLHLNWFHWHQEPKWPQWPPQPQQPQWPQWPPQPHFIKKTLF